MNSAPFSAADLAELDGRLYAKAEAVVAMEDVAAGTAPAGALGLRHDVDNTLDEAIRMADWETTRGYRSTYFIEHTAPYWHDKDRLRDGLAFIAACGHEIGLHVNALAEATTTGRDPVAILTEALDELRSYGHPVHGVVAHGDPRCYGPGRTLRFVNDEIFTESARPELGAPDREVAGVKLSPVSRLDYGLDYDPNYLPRAMYLSDSGGVWRNGYSDRAFEDVAESYPLVCLGLGGHVYPGQLHMLVHPCWWGSAF